MYVYALLNKYCFDCKGYNDVMMNVMFVYCWPLPPQSLLYSSCFKTSESINRVRCVMIQIKFTSKYVLKYVLCVKSNSLS